MIKKIVNCWIKYKTKNLTRIPLFTMEDFWGFMRNETDSRK